MFSKKSLIKKRWRGIVREKQDGDKDGNEAEYNEYRIRKPETENETR